MEGDMLLIIIYVLDGTSIHDKGKLFPIVDPTARQFESKKSLYSTK